MRADLDEGGVALVDERARRLGEANRLAQRAVPVVGVELRSVDRLAGRRRDKRQLARARLDTGELLAQPLADRLDVVRMRGVVDRDPPRPDALLLAGRDELVERRG